MIKVQRFWVRAIAVTSVWLIGAPVVARSPGLKPLGHSPLATHKLSPIPLPSSAAIASAYPLASDAGLEMLEQGGNAVDAAVATAFAISVVTPFSAGIGGGGFALHFDPETGEIKALDFRERAPGAAFRELYLDEEGKPRSRRVSLDGHLAAGVPGTVAGLAELHQKYGKLPWAQVVAPAIRLAQDGFVISQRLADRSQGRLPIMANNPAARAIFTRDGEPLAVGDRLVQEDLARTLRTIAIDPDLFYRGWIANFIAADMVAYGGLISRKDLENYRMHFYQLPLK